MKVIILIGPSGSGKSTWAKNFENENPGTWIYSADDFLIEHGRYIFDPTKLKEAHAYCLRSFNSKIIDRSNETIIADNTNTTLTEIAPYAALALAYNADLQFKVFVNVHCKFVADCIRRSIHEVPENMIRRQYYGIYQTLDTWPSYWPRYEIVTDPSEYVDENGYVR